MTSLFIAWNLGLGDSIICNGLVRELAKKYDMIHLPCYFKNYSSVDFMFSDLTNIFVKIVEEDQMKSSIEECEKIGMEVLKLGCYRNEPLEPESFDQTFYRQSRVDFECRWSCFKLPEYKNQIKWTDLEGNEFNSGVAFICDDKTRGFKIDVDRINSNLFRGYCSEGKTIFDFVSVISNAEEVHTIDTAWLHLIESIPTKGRLFYHLYARNAGPYHQAKKRKNWIILS